MQTINTVSDLQKCAEKLFDLDPRFRALHDVYGLPRLRRREGGLEGLAYTVVAQLISTKAAAAIWQRVSDNLCFQDVAAIADCQTDSLAGLGLTRAKANTIIQAAQAELDGSFSFAALRSMDDDTAKSQLLQLKGVGPWTADVYLMSCLGRVDAWPAGDLAVRVGLQIFEGLSDIPEIADMQTVAQKWQPLRSIAARYLWDHYATKKR